MDSIAQLVAQISGKGSRQAYQCLKQLEEESVLTDAVYEYIDLFIDMISSPSSYLRTRGLRLIAVNAKWDDQNKIDPIIGEYLEHILDEKPTTARQCIQRLPLLADGKPELAERIRTALLSADPGVYPDSMGPLVRKDIAQALKQIG